MITKVKGYEVIVIQWECPNCGEDNSTDYSERYAHCDNCGIKVELARR